MSANRKSQALRPSIGAPVFAGQRVKFTPRGVVAGAFEARTPA
jgi:hypothetical protein